MNCWSEVADADQRSRPISGASRRFQSSSRATPASRLTRSIRLSAGTPHRRRERERRRADRNASAAQPASVDVEQVEDQPGCQPLGDGCSGTTVPRDLGSVEVVFDEPGVRPLTRPRTAIRSNGVPARAAARTSRTARRTSSSASVVEMIFAGTRRPVWSSSAGDTPDSRSRSELESTSSSVRIEAASRSASARPVTWTITWTRARRRACARMRAPIPTAPEGDGR